jgi:hypothetical protein
MDECCMFVGDVFDAIKTIGSFVGLLVGIVVVYEQGADLVHH